MTKRDVLNVVAGVVIGIAAVVIADNIATLANSPTPQPPQHHVEVDPLMLQAQEALDSLEKRIRVEQVERWKSYVILLESTLRSCDFELSDDPDIKARQLNLPVCQKEETPALTEHFARGRSITR